MDYLFHTPLGLKAIKVTPSDEGTRVDVQHRLFGDWSFTVNLPIDVVCVSLDRMSAGSLIQDAFPTLDNETREHFITPPGLYDNLSDEEEDDGNA